MVRMCVIENIICFLLVLNLPHNDLICPNFLRSNLYRGALNCPRQGHIDEQFIARVAQDGLQHSISIFCEMQSIGQTREHQRINFQRKCF
jgi:hypothetical protein